MISEKSKNKGKVLLTGATGFIGKRLQILLEKENYEVVCVIRKKNYSSKNIKCDLEKERIQRSFLKDFKAVFHLASYCHDNIVNSPQEILKYENLNTNAVENLAKDCSACGVNEFIFLSTSKVNEKNFDEKSIYAVSKRNAEIKLKELSKKTKMNINIIRPFLVYGPDQKGNLKSLEQMMNKWWFPILGLEKNKKMMIHVDDLVKAIIYVYENVQGNFNTLSVNDGEIYSTEKICRILKNKHNFFQWKVNENVIKTLSLIYRFNDNKINKLLADDFISSNDLNDLKDIKDLGFTTNLKFRDFNKHHF